MARTPDTVEDTALRHRAYELYIEPDKDGNVRTLKSISLELGVSQPRLSYWLKTDRWLEKARSLHTLSGNPEPDDIRAALRANLAKHLNTLSAIIEGTGHDRVRVQAIREFALIAKQLGAMELSEVPVGTRRSEELLFDDTLETIPEETV